MQCCITGPAFECLLRQPNQALIQTVMLNCVAFTRMKSHQKGQLMDLLGNKGLHRMFDGQRQHIPVLLRTVMPYMSAGVSIAWLSVCLSVLLSVHGSDCLCISSFKCLTGGCPVLLSLPSGREGSVYMWHMCTEPSPAKPALLRLATADLHCGCSQSVLHMFRLRGCCSHAHRLARIMLAV